MFPVFQVATIKNEAAEKVSDLNQQKIEEPAEMAAAGRQYATSIRQSDRPLEAERGNEPAALFSTVS